MIGILKSLLTEDDDSTPDIVAVLFVVGVVVFLVLAVWAVAVNKTPFDMQSYGIGFGSVLTGGGAAIFAKKKSGA